MTLILNDLQPRGLGYVEIDQRNVEAQLPVGAVRYFEADTYTCSHCQAIVVMNPQRTRERYKCKGCAHHICDSCAAKMVAGSACETFAQRIEKVMERDLRQPEPRSILLP